MRLSLSPQLTQTQTQKLAPRMIQSMEILQLPLLALQERIEQELNENPLLELQEQDPALPEETAERENPDAPAESEKELVVDGKNVMRSFQAEGDQLQVRTIVLGEHGAETWLETFSRKG